MRSISLKATPDLVFDLAQCVVLDSVTLGILISLAMEAIRRGGGVGLSGVSINLETNLADLMLLEPTHRQLTWHVFPTVDDAVKFLSKKHDHDQANNS